MSGLQVLPVEGLPEVTRAADLAGMICEAVQLQHRDVVVVTQKVVSKAEGAMPRSTRTTRCPTSRSSSASPCGSCAAAAT